MAITKDAQPGEMISPVSAGGGFTRTGICTLVDMTSLEIEVDVNEAYINRVRAGQQAVATLDAYPDWQIPAQVITTVPAADRQKATVKVRLAFDQLDPRILPDMGVKVAFLSDEAGGGRGAARRPLVRAARAPCARTATATWCSWSRATRWSAGRSGSAPAPGDEAVITSGLAAGERVVIEGPADLADGAKVAVLDRIERQMTMETNGEALVRVRDVHKVYRRGGERLDVLKGSTSRSPRATSSP